MTPISLTRFFVYFLISGIFSLSVFADTFQNVNGFFGERAAGMGGAFSAISDDVSGAFYNPGGTAFAQNSYYSVNASSYNTISITHKNLFGPGQNYNRTSRNYLPNFLGFIKKYDKWTYGFSVVNPINQSFDQSDRIVLPIYRRNLSQMDIAYSEENFRLFAGPSVSYLLTDKLGIGLTTYYMYDSLKLIVNGNENQYNDSVVTVIEQNRRRTSGIMPVLGLQYMLTEKLSLGLSMRKIFVTGGNTSYRTNMTSSARSTGGPGGGGPSSVMVQTTDEGGSRVDAYNLTYLSPSTYQVPQINELRAGWAYFLTSKITMSADLIYTSGYKIKVLNNMYDIKQNHATLSDPYANDLKRNQTLNYSIGFEYFIFDNIVLRFGHFTNRSNNEKVTWGEAALMSVLRQSARGGFEYQISRDLGYIIPEKRNQYINVTGYSFGIGFENAKNSVSLTFIIQNGQGIGTIDRNQLPTTSAYKENTIYLSGSTRY